MSESLAEELGHQMLKNIALKRAIEDISAPSEEKKKHKTEEK